MLNNNQSSGFTIIEIIFVIAIGGLILIMSFLAISSAQRNKRDTQRKADLASINQNIGSWTSENHGILPADLSSITMPTPPSGGSYSAHVTTNVSTSACPDENHIYYQRINDRSYKIKICLEAGDYTEEH